MKTLKRTLAFVGMFLTLAAIVVIGLILMNLGACVRGDSYDNSIFLLIISLPWYIKVASVVLMAYYWMYTKKNPGKIGETLNKVLF